jgi:hypothetical protein
MPRILNEFYVHEFGFRVRHASLRVGTLLSVVSKVSIKTNDAFRLFAWPGWKQTVTRLVAEKPVIESKHQLRPGPADLHLFAGSWKPEGIAYVYIWLETPEGHPGQQAYTFRLLSTSLTSVSIFSVSCCSRYVSLWWHGIRGGHRHRQVGRMPDTDLIPDIRSKGVKYHIFSKNRRQRSCPLSRSFLIVDEPNFYTVRTADLCLPCIRCIPKMHS